MADKIKKRSATHIYYGEDASTGELHHISEVESGKRCNCICVYCKQPFEARKGDIRRHHFGHVSNYDCMYAAEVAVYKAAATLLDAEKKMMLPRADLRFPAWSHAEIVQKSVILHFDKATFVCEDRAYPPDLYISVGENRLRVLLNFDYYFSNEDIHSLGKQAAESGYSCLLYEVPRISEDEFFTPDNLRKVFREGNAAEWLHNRNVEKWRERFLETAYRPNDDESFECPIHRHVGSAVHADEWPECGHCRYNASPDGGCLCLAVKGVAHISDFDDDEQSRQKRIAIERVKNDDARRKREEEAKRRAELRRQRAEQQRAEQQRQLQQARSRQNYAPRTHEEERHHGPTEAEKTAEYKRIASAFDISATAPTVDRYGRRWIRCKLCGEVKLDVQMMEYGGRDNGPNQGTCSDCNRKRYRP